MVRLRDIPRTATFAWSPGSGKPLIVTGTRAGAVDADFSDESKLEIWDLALDDQNQGLELQPLASIPTDSRFYDIAWGPADSDHPDGIIAGALENGALDIWDAAKLKAGASDALISHTTKHTGSIKTLQFNPLKPQILATAGTNGELYIYDVNDIENPFRLGNAAARSDDIDCLAWNRKVSHILATGGSGGFVTVWDLKTKKASLTLNNSRKAVSAIAWDPNNSTKLLTATPDDNAPVILLWDLRNSNAPEKTLQGHEQGVLSLSWCQQDGDLLLSSGKDNRTVIWNPQTGERYGELPEVTNWTFMTRFNPHNPSLSATASFEGKIAVQTLQNTNPTTAQSTTDKNLDDEDFFSKAQSQPQDASWSLVNAPKWLQRPVGASFGFGGKVVVFKANPTQPGQKRSSTVSLTQFTVDSEVSAATEKFQEALASGDLLNLCGERKQQAQSDEERADWEVMENLVGDNPRPKIVGYLGFEENDVLDGNASIFNNSDKKSTETLNTEAEEQKKKRVSTFFNGDDGDLEDDGDDFLTSFAAHKGAKTESPFHLFSSSDSPVDKKVTSALLLGNFAKATEICLSEDRTADAFLIANCGGPELVDKVQAAYLSRKTGMPSYLRLIGSVIAKNLWDVVYNADLENWKEVMAIICTFSSPDEFPDLCETLGDRIQDHGQRKDASFCYLVGSKLEKVVSIWITELQEAEQEGLKQSSADSTFSVHARSLQHFIEKVTIFRQVTKFRDDERELSSDWKLSALYDKYTEYANVLSAHGQLEVARRYLDLLPTSYPAAEIARNRVRLATQKAAPQPAAKQSTMPSRAAARTQPPLATQPPAQSFPQPSNSHGGYAPAAVPTSQGQSYTPQNPYQPHGYQAPRQPNFNAPSAGAPPMGGPPRNSTPTGTASAARSKNVDNWNDVPLVAKPPPRRATPNMAPIMSPFPGQAGQSGPPPPGQFGGSTPPPPPPPKGPTPARVQSPLTGPPQSSQGPPRPTPNANSQYTPSLQQNMATPLMPPTMPRTASPYNAPPPGQPPSNRYAPAPSSQQSSNQSSVPSMAPPQGPGSRPPPTGAYGARPSHQQPPPSNQYAPQQYGGPSGQQPSFQQGPPTAGPPLAARSGPPPGATATPPPPKSSIPPSNTKHPAGDRSHIPAHAQELFSILESDMQRVASKAPATYAPQVKDTQKRLGRLYDHLNNEEVVKPATIEELSHLAQALLSKDYVTAQKYQAEIARDKADECVDWMIGVKRLISMSKATP